MDNELIVKALKASITEISGDSTNTMIAKHILSIQLEEQKEEMQQVKNERDEALVDLKNIKASFEKINDILQSDEQLKNLYEEVKARQIEKG